MNYLTKYFEEKEIAHIVMNNPKKLNALSPKMSESLIGNFIKAERSPNVKMIILSSSGDSFCAGGDINTMESLHSLEDIFNWMESSSNLTKIMREMEKYIVSAVNGHIAGAGISLALASDFVIAHESSKFTFSFSNIGLIPDLGLLKLLTERVPINVAKEWISFAKSLNAHEALNYHLVNKVEKGTQDILIDAIEFSKHLLNNSYKSNKFTKEVLNNIDSINLNETIYKENLIQTILLQSDYHKEKAKLFLNK